MEAFRSDDDSNPTLHCLQLYDHNGRAVTEDGIETTDSVADRFFRGPNSQGTYGLPNFAPVEEIVRAQFYKRSHGMICIGVKVNCF